MLVPSPKICAHPIPAWFHAVQAKKAPIAGTIIMIAERVVFVNMAAAPAGHSCRFPPRPPAVLIGACVAVDCLTDSVGRIRDY